MKKRIDRYKLTNYFQRLICVLLAAQSVLVAAKGIYMYRKIAMVKAGLRLYDDEEWLEAENKLQEAVAASYFEYKEQVADSTLDELSWITNYHDILEKLYNQLIACREKMDYELFLTTVSEYEALGMEQLKAYQKDYYEVQYPINKAINENWIQFKGYMQSLLERPLDETKYNWAKVHILQVPEEYFSGSRLEAIGRLFERCDDQLFQKISMGQGDLSSKLALINKIYSINSECGYETTWLNDKVKAYIIETLKEQMLQAGNEELNNVRNNSKIAIRGQEDSKTVKDIESFFQRSKNQMQACVNLINEFKSLARPEYDSQEIIQIIEDYLNQKEAEIQVLIDSEYYDEAISWYTVLNSIKDFSPEIKRLESLKYFEDPVLLIEKQLPQCIDYEIGRGAIGADLYLVAVNKETLQVEVYQVIGTEEENTCTRRSIDLKSIGIQDEALQAIKNHPDTKVQIAVYGDLVSVLVTKNRQSSQGEEIVDTEESIVSTSSQAIAIFKVSQETLSPLFNQSGENIEISPDLSTLSIMNPTEEDLSGRYGANTFTYIYHYDGEGYSKQQEQIVVSNLRDIDVGTYIGQMIQFSCYISEVSNGQSVMCYGYTEGAYYQDKGALLQLADVVSGIEVGDSISPGYYVVTGEVIGETTYFVEGINQEVRRPEIHVTQLVAER